MFTTATIVLLLLVGIFIGSTASISVALYFENRSSNRAELELAKEYVREFGGTIREARQIIRSHGL